MSTAPPTADLQIKVLFECCFGEFQCGRASWGSRVRWHGRTHTPTRPGWYHSRQELPRGSPGRASVKAPQPRWLQPLPKDEPHFSWEGATPQPVSEMTRGEQGSGPPRDPES